jgi:hypothetical protein
VPNFKGVYKFFCFFREIEPVEGEGRLVGADVHVLADPLDGLANLFNKITSKRLGPNYNSPFDLKLPIPVFNSRQQS